jgi:DMSO/TMAO reductase YedYZ heme-binding membrane subunit
MLDSYVHFGVRDVLVPFASSWRPAAVAWGIVGLYLLAAVEISSLARKRLSHRIWRRLHFLSFPLFATATFHLLAAGTDAHSALVLTAVAVAGTAVAGLTAWRIHTSTSSAAIQPAPGTRIPGRAPRAAMMETVGQREEVRA